MSDQQTIVNPDLDDVLVQMKNEIFSTMNCIQIGKIEKVNSNQTVEIQIQVKRRISGNKTASYPILVDCPYVVLQGGGAYIDMPIKKGDYCLIIFNDRNINNWWDAENVAIPEDRRKHSLSDGMALVGINPKTKVLAADGSIVRILGTSGPGSEEFAARVNDPTTSSTTEDPAFWTWVSLITSVVNGLSGGAVGPPPSSQAGKIQSGSSGVKIG